MNNIPNKIPVQEIAKRKDTELEKAIDALDDAIDTMIDATYDQAGPYHKQATAVDVLHRFYMLCEKMQINRFAVLQAYNNRKRESR